MLLASAGTSMAGLTKVYYDNGKSSGQNSVDAKFEDQGQWLQTEYGLNDNVRPNGTTSTTVLPQVERAVAQLAGNNANGLFVPLSASGIPGQSYLINGGPATGEGVYNALTNHSVIGNNSNGGTASGTFANFRRGDERTVRFEFKRVGNVISYSAGDSNGTRTWVSSAEDYFKEANAIEFRIRSHSNSEIKHEDLVYNDTDTNDQELDDIEAEDNDVTIALFSGVSGDFSIKGKFKYDPNSSSTGWNHQIKALALPDLGGNNGGNNVVPEPASMAIFGALGGMLGWARLRRRNRA